MSGSFYMPSKYVTHPYGIYADTSYPLGPLCPGCNREGTVISEKQSDGSTKSRCMECDWKSHTRRITCPGCSNSIYHEINTPCHTCGYEIDKWKGKFPYKRCPICYQYTVKNGICTNENTYHKTPCKYVDEPLHQIGYTYTDISYIAEAYPVKCTWKVIKIEPSYSRGDKRFSPVYSETEDLIAVELATDKDEEEYYG